MKRFLTAIAFMVGLASPVSALMAEGLSGLREQPPPSSYTILGVLLIQTIRYPDKFIVNRNGDCEGIGRFSFYSMDTAYTIRTLDDRVIDSASPFKSEKTEQELIESCMFFVRVKSPDNETFTLTINGIMIPAKVYDINVNEGGSSSMLVNIDLLDIIKNPVTPSAVLCNQYLCR